MSAPDNFTWIDRPLLAAHARPHDADELVWLRQQGIELIITLTEDSLRRDWLSDASLLGLHVPVVDMDAPTIEQVEQILSAVKKAHERNMGVAVHCAVGRGRTGTVLACYFVAKGMGPREAIRHVRKIRPGSIETEDQEDLIDEFARRGFGITRLF
jgi:atypical dual specificity phosphatase